MKSLTCNCAQRAKINQLIKSIKKDDFSQSYLKKLDRTFVKELPKIKCKPIIPCPPTESLCEIFSTPNMGRGIRAKVELFKGEKIGCYIGSIKAESYTDETWKYAFQYTFKDYSIDGSSIESMMSLLNHSDNPNCNVDYEIHKVDGIEEIHLTFFLLKDVLPGQEIFIDYGQEYWEYANKNGIHKDIKQKLITDYFTILGKYT